MLVAFSIIIKVNFSLQLSLCCFSSSNIFIHIFPTGTHSIVLMGIADAEYKLIYFDVGRNGKFTDGGVFNRCTFGQALDSKQLCLPPPKALPGRDIPVPHVLEADVAFDASRTCSASCPHDSASCVNPSIWMPKRRSKWYLLAAFCTII